MNFDDLDILEKVAHYQLNENKIMQAHDWRTYGFWAVVVAIGIVQALNSQGVNLGDVNVILGVLGFLEHFFAGQTSTNPSSNVATPTA